MSTTIHYNNEATEGKSLRRWRSGWQFFINKVDREKWYRKPFLAPKPGTFTIASNYNFFKIAASLFQTVFALWTLYTTRGDQTAQYGYAAFGLTVVPYAWMSIINLIGHLVCPEYPAMYVVDLPAYRRPQRYHFSGCYNSPVFWNLAWILGTLFYLVVICAPLAAVAGLSSFKAGHSTTSQRVWTMLWLGSGILAALVRFLLSYVHTKVNEPESTSALSQSKKIRFLERVKLVLSGKRMRMRELISVKRKSRLLFLLRERW